MRKFLLAAAMALCLAGCASTVQKIEDAYTAVTQAKVSYKIALESVQVFKTLQDAGNVYLGLPTCTKSTTAACHDRRSTRQINALLTSGRIAANGVLDYVAANPCDPQGQCPLMPNGVYDSLTSVVSALQSVYSQYKIGMGS